MILLFVKILSSVFTPSTKSPRAHNNQPHGIWRYLIVCGLLFIGSLVSAESQKPLIETQKLVVTGTASNLETGKIVYREYHEIMQQKNQHAVRYMDPQGHLIATKNIQYTHGFNTPEYQLHDKRFDRHTGSVWQEKHFTVFRQEKNEKPHEKNFSPADDLVIDAGFDSFIRSHWSELLDGKILPFSFVVADPLLLLNMQLAEVSSSQTAIQQHSEQYRYFLISSRNHLIGWAIPDIHLAYDHDSHLLQIYQGPSNLTDQHNNSQIVLVRYEYQQPLVTRDGVRTP